VKQLRPDASLTAVLTLERFDAKVSHIVSDPSGQSARAKAKARLALRAERAFGLNEVRARVIDSPAMAFSQSAAARPTAAAPANVKPSPPVRHVAAALPPASRKPTASPMMPLPSLLAPFTAAPLTADEKRIRLAAMDESEVRGCTLCRLCETRTKTVFGEGDADAKIFFIGEGPGENEDLTGRPFVGKAGQLLDKMIGAMGLRREQVFIANIVKCRPPNNRGPAPDEVGTCTPYLERQLEIIRPRVIVTLGLPAAKYMLQENSTMGKLRGRWHSWREIKLMPTFHPAYILRSYTPETRAAVWSDLQLVMTEIGLTPPSRAE
jgi:uracil-DNA glycosylase family 4